jgi:RNA polymerase sigma-70 factor (ECF subfamily)
MTDSDRNHDDAAWLRETVRRYESALVGYAARLLGNAERARDVAQDTFLQLCRQPRCRVEGRERPWLFAVCRNRALDVLKKEHRMTTLSHDQAEQCAGRDPDPTADAQRQDAVRLALAALESLPANQQEVIRLKVQEGLSYREISEVTGLSVSNVGFLLHRGIQTIRLRLTGKETEHVI